MTEKFKTTWFWSNLKTIESDLDYLLNQKSHCISLPSVDFDDFARCLQNAYEELDTDGYDVINVVPIIMKEPVDTSQSDDTVGSITRGAIVIGKKKNWYYI